MQAFHLLMSGLHIPVLKGLIVGVGGEPTPPGHLTGTWLFLLELRAFLPGLEGSLLMKLLVGCVL